MNEPGGCIAACKATKSAWPASKLLVQKLGIGSGPVPNACSVIDFSVVKVTIASMASSAFVTQSRIVKLQLRPDKTKP